MTQQQRRKIQWTEEEDTEPEEDKWTDEENTATQEEDTVDR